MGTMDVWYARLSEQELMADIKIMARSMKDKEERKEAKKGEKRARKVALKARTRDSMQALSKLAELVDGKYRIISQPPIVIPARELGAAVACRPTSSSRSSGSSSARTAPRWRSTGAICWSASR